MSYCTHAWSREGYHAKGFSISDVSTAAAFVKS